MIEEDTRRAVARHRLEVWLWVLLDKHHPGLQLLPQVCEMCFVIYLEVYQEQKKWWDNAIFTIRVPSRPTAVLTWAASLGWTSAVTCCNVYREYHVPVVLEFLHYIRTLILLVSSLKKSFIRNVTRSNSRIMWMAVFSQFCFIMHISPLPPCGLYSIRAQNGYGQHRPCKTVLLTLVTPTGVTDLYFSWGINIEHARLAYHKTCGTEYQQPYRRCNSQTPYFNWNIS